MIVIVTSKITNGSHHNEYDKNEKLGNRKHSQNVIQTHSAQMRMENGAQRVAPEARLPQTRSL